MDRQILKFTVLLFYAFEPLRCHGSVAVGGRSLYSIHGVSTELQSMEVAAAVN